MSQCDFPDCGVRLKSGTRCYLHEGQPIPKPRAVTALPMTPLTPLSSSFARSVERGRLRQLGLERPVVSPWRELNDTLGGGFWPGLHMLVAGTGVGKTQLCLQIAVAAAKLDEPAPVGLIELELDEMQLALRILGEDAGVGWSNAYLGKSSNDQYTRLEESAERLKNIPVYTDFGDAMSWGSGRLRAMAESMRKAHPVGPLLIVLDFLQLTGCDPGEERLDLRERIGRAAYQARMVSRKYGVSVIVVSSTARDNYGALSAKMDKTGLTAHQGQFSVQRQVLNPDALIGTGKESGELEYAADSVTVLIRPKLTAGQCDPVIQELHEQGGNVVIAATVKVRAGVRSWFALAFQKGRFSSLPEQVSNSLGGVKEEHEPQETADDGLSRRVEAIVSFLHASKAAGVPVTGQRQLREVLDGSGKARHEAIRVAFLQMRIRANPITKCIEVV